MTIVADDKGTIGGFVSVEIHLWNNLAQLHGVAVSAERLREGPGRCLSKRRSGSLANEVVVVSARTRPSTTSVDALFTWLEAFMRITR
ncbi:MAG TPA: hypothetical protein VE644_08835 [Gaiellaceae bacterium]|nr:hypothetical protein [Gaiellaceae bacterium]